jgi:hypothetical protein
LEEWEDRLGVGVVGLLSVVASVDGATGGGMPPAFIEGVAGK